MSEEVQARPMAKIARTAARSWVARHLSTKQNNLCPLCKTFIDLRIKGEGVIDHNHDTGEVRAVLHRSCNAAEGKVANAAGAWGAKSQKYEDIERFVQSLLDYWRAPGAGVIYFAHKTADEKKDAKNLKARTARAANKAKLALRSRKVV